MHKTLACKTINLKYIISNLIRFSKRRKILPLFCMRKKEVKERSHAETNDNSDEKKLDCIRKVLFRES